MKILVVDDHALVREGLRQVLKGLDEQVEVLEAPHCARAFELTALHTDLDLVLLDYHLPDMNGLQALKVFGKNHPELPIIVLSGSVDQHVARQVLAGGAAGFIAKASMSGELLNILQRVLDGEIYVPPDLSSAPPPRDGLAPLTPRQEEVLDLLLSGRTNKEISQALQLSEETTKNHVSGILRNFGVQTRSQAIIEAGRRGYSTSVSST